jgi:hypothetical protein
MASVPPVVNSTCPSPSGATSTISRAASPRTSEAWPGARVHSRSACSLTAATMRGCGRPARRDPSRTPLTSADQYTPVSSGHGSATSSTREPGPNQPREHRTQTCGAAVPRRSSSKGLPPRRPSPSTSATSLNSRSSLPQWTWTNSSPSTRVTRRSTGLDYSSHDKSQLRWSIDGTAGWSRCGWQADERHPKRPSLLRGGHLQWSARISCRRG